MIFGEKGFKIRQMAMIFIAFAFFFCGCERKPGVYVEEGRAKLLEQLGEEDAFLVVNGRELLKRDYLAFRSLREKLFRIWKKKPLMGFDKEAAEYTTATEQHIPEYLMVKVLLEQAAARAGVVATSNTVQFVRDRYERKFRKRKLDVSSLAKQLGPEDGRTFLEVVAWEALEEAYYRHEATNDISVVSAGEVARRIKLVKEFNARAAKFNEESRQKALKVRKEILEGRISFEDAAAKWAQVSPEHGKAWQTVELGEIPSGSDLREWLATAKGGDLSEPLDLDDGLAIVGLLGKYKGVAPPGMAAPDLYDLVKCTFYAHETSPELSAEDWRDILAVEQRKAVKEVVGKKLTTSAVIVFPRGAKLFPPVDGGGGERPDLFKMLSIPGLPGVEELGLNQPGK